MNQERQVMKQTPIHDSHNPDLLRLIPSSCKKIIEIGCSSGALAREFKKQYNDVNWIGLEIESSYAEQANSYCDKTLVSNIEECNEDFYKELSDRDCWIFGDVLEHLKDPWMILKNIRNVIPREGCIVACIPNAQHWSVIVRLVMGDFRYEDSGLLDRTHLRWFTRLTMIELFESQGFKIVKGFPRVFNEPNRDQFLPFIVEMAKNCGINSERVTKDIIPLQFVVLAVPS